MHFPTVRRGQMSSTSWMNFEFTMTGPPTGGQEKRTCMIG